MCTHAQKYSKSISPEINHDTSLFTSFYIVFTNFDSKIDQVVVQMRPIEDSLCFYTRLVFILSFKFFFFYSGSYYCHNGVIYVCGCGCVVSALDVHAGDPGSIPGLNT